MDIITPPMSIIQFKTLRFVLASQPSVINLRSYIKELLQYKTKALIKVTECSYSIAIFGRMGITVNEFIINNGTFPASTLIDQWIEFVGNYFGSNPGSALAVHCQSGLGRSAILVAIAFIECGLEKFRVIETIRRERRGAFNRRQLEKLMEYQSQQRLAQIFSQL